MSKKNCNYCEGKGYIEIRDCTGEIQREETCVFCDGTGKIEDNKE
jgi:DnaJ-class molecular chaperone